jgi:hypothetical protein
MPITGSELLNVWPLSVEYAAKSSVIAFGFNRFPCYFEFRLKILVVGFPTS